MANLGDAFKKAGLISAKDHRRQKHEQRVRRKEVGREGLLDEEARAEEERLRRREEQRGQAREVEKARQAALQAAAARARALDLLRSHAIVPAGRGTRRWHYVDADRSGAVAALDLIRFRQLLLGTVPATQVWLGAALATSECP